MTAGTVITLQNCLLIYEKIIVYSKICRMQMSSTVFMFLFSKYKVWC